MHRHPQLKLGNQLGYVIYDRKTMEIWAITSFTPYVYPFEESVPGRFVSQSAAKSAIKKLYPFRSNLAVVAFANYVDYMQKKTGLSVTRDLY